jgi:hypothetical protein
MVSDESTADRTDILSHGEVFTLLFRPIATVMDTVVLSTFDLDSGVHGPVMSSSVLSTAEALWMRAGGTVGRVSLIFSHRGRRREAEATVVEIEHQASLLGRNIMR